MELGSGGSTCPASPAHVTIDTRARRPGAIANGSPTLGIVVTPSSHAPSGTISPTVTDAEPLFVSVALALPAVFAGGRITVTGGDGATPPKLAASATPSCAREHRGAGEDRAFMLTVLPTRPSVGTNRFASNEVPLRWKNRS